MKKVLFVCYGLGIGGIEKCLVNLINTMPEQEYSVDLLLLNPEYELKSGIKRHVKYLEFLDYAMNTTDTIKEIQKHGGIAKNLLTVCRYCAFRVAVKLEMDSWKLFRSIETAYDIAVAYSHHDYSPYYVIDKVKAKRKVLWYHNGAYEESGKRAQLDQKYYPRFDTVVAVSNDCAKVLKRTFPFQDKQLIVLRNICDADEIIRKSKESLTDIFGEKALHIVTVGRLTKEKGAEIALDVCATLASEGRNFIWHWIGDGNQHEFIQSEIENRDLKGYFRLEGNKVNPYPYMNAADLYVQPSFYEAYSTTITEAMILCKPIITTDVGGMRDQLRNLETGIIVPIDVSSLTDAIRGLIDNKERRMQLSMQLMQERYDTRKCLDDYWKTVFSEVER